MQLRCFRIRISRADPRKRCFLESEVEEAASDREEGEHQTHQAHDHPDRLVGSDPNNGPPNGQWRVVQEQLPMRGLQWLRFIWIAGGNGIFEQDKLRPGRFRSDFLQPFGDGLLAVKLTPVRVRRGRQRALVVRRVQGCHADHELQKPALIAVVQGQCAPEHIGEVCTRRVRFHHCPSSNASAGEDRPL